METQATVAKKCKAGDCKRPYRAKGFCNVHYKKWRRGKMTKKPRYKTCGEEKCRAPLFKSGFCEKHYQSWKATKSGEAAIAAPAATAVPEATPAPAGAPATPPKKPAETAKEGS